MTGELAQLVARAAAGEQAAWDSIVARYERLVWATIRGFGLDRASAEDVAQSTWYRLVDQIGAIRNPEGIGSWLVTTARREAIRTARHAQRVRPAGDATELPMDTQPVAAFLAADLVAQEDRSAVREGLATLTERCQALLRIWSLDPQPSYNEISASLEMPVGSIGPTLERCLQRLRTALGWDVSPQG